MNIRGFARRAGWLAVVLAASFWVVPNAFARVHVGIGISVPGVAIGIGNCWRCGYPPPVYYQPAYAAPVYYPAPVYYSPRPVYYGPGYYAPYYPRHRYYHGYGRGHRWHHYHDGYYYHRHHH